MVQSFDTVRHAHFSDANQVQRQWRRGFTLVELLVVIGIIALLMGILLPVLSRTRASAADLKCQSNVRQISAALMIYATECEGYLPPAEDSTLPQGRPTWHTRIWQRVIGRPFQTDDFTGGGTYSYLQYTVFECPQAEGSRLGSYSSMDHRTNGYALNISVPGGYGENAMANPFQQLRILDHKKPAKVKTPSETLMLVDAKGFYVEYFDRGRAQNSMDAGISNAGGMLAALGRHGKRRDRWNVAFFDGSVRFLSFDEVPGTPDQYYTTGARLTPRQLLSSSDVSPMTKRFWVGREY
jgi:prepilin-type N-terminal cleavage/methylation domain-containing protein/prepilin-type processing-associated H-X9-DG protein